MDYFEKLFNVSSNNVVALECFNIFKNLILHSKEEEKKIILLKYLGRIWIKHDLPVEADDENLVILNIRLYKI